MGELSLKAIWNGARPPALYIHCEGLTPKHPPHVADNFIVQSLWTVTDKHLACCAFRWRKARPLGACQEMCRGRQRNPGRVRNRLASSPVTAAPEPNWAGLKPNPMVSAQRFRMCIKSASHICLWTGRGCPSCTRITQPRATVSGSRSPCFSERSDQPIIMTPMNIFSVHFDSGAVDRLNGAGLTYRTNCSETGAKHQSLNHELAASHRSDYTQTRLGIAMPKDH